MKITDEQKQLLGLQTAGEDVPEQTILDAAISLAKAGKVSPVELAELSLKAKAGETLLVQKRSEVKRLATLAELGAEEGTLNDVLAGTIEKATAEELVSLEKYYRGKVGDKLPVGGQSSLENIEETEQAGGLNETTKKTVKSTKLL